MHCRKDDSDQTFLRNRCFTIRASVFVWRTIIFSQQCGHNLTTWENPCSTARVHVFASTREESILFLCCASSVRKKKSTLHCICVLKCALFIPSEEVLCSSSLLCVRVWWQIYKHSIIDRFSLATLLTTFFLCPGTTQRQFSR